MFNATTTPQLIEATDSDHGVLSVFMHNSLGAVIGRMEYTDMTEAIHALWTEHIRSDCQYAVEMQRQSDNQRVVIDSDGMLHSWEQ